MFLAAAATAASAPDGGHVAYVVRQGDTLSEIAERYIVPERDWQDLKRISRIRDPHRLPVRTTLKIPRQWLRWSPERAELVSVRGSVSVSSDGRTIAPAVGAELPEGARITTAGSSFVTLALANGTRIALPSASRVTIVRLRKYLIDETIDYRFRLENGRIDTKAAPLRKSGSEVIVTTPIAMTAVRGTEYSVAFDDGRQLTGTGVFEGTVSVSALDGSRPQITPEGFGALTDAQGGSRKIALLPAPAMQVPGRVQTEQMVTFDLDPVTGARGYHAVLASDAGFIERYAEQQSASPHFEFPDVPNGNQFVRISAIGEGELRGMRQSYSFSRRLAALGADVSEGADGYAFRWFGTGEGTRHYRLQILMGAPDGPAIVDEVGLTGNGATVSNLPPGIYFWRVALSQQDAQGTIDKWTEPEKLTISGADGG